MSSNESAVWINGSLTPVSLARISVFDHAFTVGDGAFETLRAYGGSIFAITLHWQRLATACARLGIACPSRQEFQTIMETTLSASGLQEARVRFTVSSGQGPAGSRRGSGETTQCCTVAPFTPYLGSERVCIVPWPRNERGALAGIKSVSYGENVIALSHARERGFGEAIFANTQGELCEGATSNVFIVREGTVHTPPLTSGCLGGVTRTLVLDLCQAHHIPFSEAPLALSELALAPEAFLTSSTREVQAISQVDDTPLSPTVGSLTERIAGLLHEMISHEPDPHPARH